MLALGVRKMAPSGYALSDIGLITVEHFVRK
jgi:hypothetical protein